MRTSEEISAEVAALGALVPRPGRLHALTVADLNARLRELVDPIVRDSDEWNALNFEEQRASVLAREWVDEAPNSVAPSQTYAGLAD